MFSTDKIKILMITDFSEFLDNYTPIFAVHECNKEGMNIQLDIYGQGRDLSKIQNCIKNQNCENIQYKGGFQDFTTIYKDYDLFITSSYSCDIQMNTIEAMRAGLPLLLTDIKGNGESEFIKGNGYLMPENAKHPAIISKELFYRVQDRLIDPNKRRKHDINFAYTGLIKCGHCGCKITAERKKNRQGEYKYIYYHCTGNNGGDCIKHSTTEKDLDAAISAAIKHIVIPPDLREEILKKLKIIHEKKYEYSENKKNTINKRIDFCDKKMKTILKI